MKKTVITLVVLAVVGCAAYFLCKDKCCKEAETVETVEAVADTTKCACDSTACAACEGCAEGECGCENK